MSIQIRTKIEKIGIFRTISILESKTTDRRGGILRNYLEFGFVISFLKHLLYYLKSGVNRLGENLAERNWRRWRYQLRVNSSSIEGSIKGKMNAAAGMKAASISASPRLVNQLPVSFSFVTPCVSPLSLNHSSKCFDSCRLHCATSYSSHLAIDFSTRVDRFEESTYPVIRYSVILRTFNRFRERER